MIEHIGNSLDIKKYNTTNRENKLMKNFTQKKLIHTEKYFNLLRKKRQKATKRKKYEI